jgi:hypothetical protein
MLNALNASVRRHTNAQRARVAIQLVTLAEGAVGLFAPLVALATGPTIALGEAVIKRRLPDTHEKADGAISLLAKAQQALK